MTFLQELEDFLLNLRDNYAFNLPVDRLKSCLHCAENITNLSEVYYRLQSLACSSQEQTEIFQSVFGKTFLKIDAKYDSKSQSELQKKLLQITQENEQLKSNLSKKEQQLKEIQENLSQAQSNQQSVNQSIEKAKEELKAFQEISPVSEKEMQAIKSAASPDLENPKVKGLMEQLMNQVPRTSSYFKPEKLKTNITATMQSENYNIQTDEIIKSLMQAAQAARNQKDMAAFKTLLSMIDTMKKLKSAASRSIQAKDKKALATAKKATQGRDKTAEKFEEKIDKLEQKSESLAEEQEWLRRRKMDAEAQLERTKARTEMRTQQLQREHGEVQDAILKEKALSHRPEFMEGVRAVQTTNEVAELMQTDLKRMSSEEKQQILSYIRSNARVFRQTLRRKGSSIQHRQVDIKATIRKARRTDGEPVSICYKKPKKSHAKVIILADISGSCRRASELTLYFMALMNEAFPGGCEKFVFVNHLVPVNQYFRDKSPDEGVETVVNTVPTRGIYSDYGRTIQELRDECAGRVHKDTTIIILGDARNNKNDSHAEDLKFLADRAYRVFWLNTDDPNEWNQGDSVISQYEKAGSKVFSVQTAGDLLGFLQKVSEKNI